MSYLPAHRSSAPRAVAPRPKLKPPRPKKVGQPAKKKPRPKKGGGDTSGVFNPAKHSIAEVLAYVEANPAEIGAVVIAERAGKARASLLAKLEPLLY